MFPKSSAENVLEQSLRNTTSLQNLIDLLEQHSIKVVSSYDAIYPNNPPSSTNLNPATSPGPQLPTPGSLPLAPRTTPPEPASGLDTGVPPERRASLWERLKDIITSS
jgi:hypothetical protein